MIIALDGPAASGKGTLARRIDAHADSHGQGAPPPGMDARALSYGTALQNVGSGGAALAAGLMAPYLGLRAYFWLASGMIMVGILMWRRLERR